MDYNPVDSSGTDDDLPPTYQNRGVRGSGRVSGNGRDIVTLFHIIELSHRQIWKHKFISLSKMHIVLFFVHFKAQSDAISWEKEGLITELRKELRVSDKEHRELLNRVNGDDIIQRIREWRETKGGLQADMVNNAQRSHDRVPSPTTSARKRGRRRHNPSLLLLYLYHLLLCIHRH
ncbi:hypothetical protein EE612_043517 [Oryza sativa]|nr:hypothetical protein EE612_043517 [Oryza sativa]KAB8108139.1 hypothetical protein EE612_043517 [Oryza sativa]